MAQMLRGEDVESQCLLRGRLGSVSAPSLTQSRTTCIRRACPDLGVETESYFLIPKCLYDIFVRIGGKFMHGIKSLPPQDASVER